MPDNTLYAHAVGRIRCIERKLLDRNKLERMIESSGPDEALKVLIEADYGSEDVINDARNFELLLRDEMEKTYGLLKKLIPEAGFLDVFLLKNDYHNLKVILKSEFQGISPEGILNGYGIIPTGKLEAILRDRKLDLLSDVMKDAVSECIDTYNRTKDPQNIDLILDRALYKEMVIMAVQVKNSFISEIARVSIDLLNIKTFLRIKAMGRTLDFLDKAILSGGTIPKEFFLESLDNSLEGFSGKMLYGAYGKVCEEGINSFIERGSLAKLEKLSDEYIQGLAMKAKYISDGVEPLIAYLIAVENEIKNVRIIMVGKRNSISADIIRERLRTTYV